MDTQNTNTAFASMDVAKIVEDSIFWFEQRIEMLNDILEAKGTIVLANPDGTDLKLNDEQSVAFRAGMATAKSILGEFPLSLYRPTYTTMIEAAEEK